MNIQDYKPTATELNNIRMKEQEIIEGNKLIAEFMGEKAIGGYHQSWDWLMPVVEKIQSLKIGDDVTYVKYAYLRTFMYDEDTNEYFVRLNGFQMFKGKSLIEALYISVIDFIKWHNKKEITL